MKQFKIIAIVSVLSFLAGKYIFPPQPQIKEVVKYVEKKKIDEKKDKKKTVVTIETKKPDGTVVKETKVVEDTKSSKNTTSDISSSKTVESGGSKVTIGVLALKDLNDLSRTNYGIITVVPLLGRLSVVGSADTSKRIGVGLSIGF